MIIIISNIDRELREAAHAEVIAQMGDSIVGTMGSTRYARDCVTVNNENSNSTVAGTGSVTGGASTAVDSNGSVDTGTASRY